MKKELNNLFKQARKDFEVAEKNFELKEYYVVEYCRGGFNMGRKQDKVIDLLQKFRKKIEKKINVDKIILFGSQATGKAGQGSDIDFIIVSNDFEGQKSFKRAPMFYYMWDFDHDADIICLTPEEVNKKKKQLGIISEALKEGLVIK